MDCQQPGERYVRHMYTDGMNQLIICFLDQMVKALIEQESFEVDMSFKRVAGPMNEVLFAGYVATFEQRKYSIFDYNTIAYFL
jgi:hypothetical protein